MNNLISKIVGVCLGLSLATGVGVGVAAGNQEVKAVNAASDSTSYSLVTSTSDLQTGKSYLITTGKTGSIYSMSAATKANNRDVVSLTVSNSKVTRGSAALSVTLGGSSGAWTFATENYAGTAGYLNATNTTSNNYLKVVANLDNYAKFSISFGASDNAVITCTGKSSRHIVMYNSGSSLISCYTSGYSDVYLWKEAGAATSFTVSYDANGATSGTVPVDNNTYSSGSQATVLGNTGNLQKTGYTFSGWTYGGNTYQQGDKITLSSSVTLAAKWYKNDSISAKQASYQMYTGASLVLSGCVTAEGDGALSFDVDTTQAYIASYDAETYTVVAHSTNTGGPLTITAHKGAQTTTFTITVVTRPSSGDFELFSGAIEEGDYVIYYNGYSLKAEISSDRFTNVSVTPANDKIVNPDSKTIWHIEADGNYWTLFNDDTDKYAASTGVKNKGKLESSVTDNSRWTISGTSTYEFVNKANTAAGVNANLRQNGANGWACYATSTGGALSLYKMSSTRTLDHITVTGSMTKTTYSLTDDWDPTGLTVTAYYDNSYSKDVTNDVEWSFSPAKPNNTNIVSVTATATYSEGEVEESASSSAQTVSVQNIQSGAFIPGTNGYSNAGETSAIVWENEGQYTQAYLNGVSFTAHGGNNTGKYYTSGSNWRFYQTETPKLTISVALQYKITSITFEYDIKNTGVLLAPDGTTNIASEAEWTPSSNSNSFDFFVGNTTSATNGQVQFTKITVVYTENTSPIVSVNAPASDLTTGDEGTFTAQTLNATNPVITWASSNSSIISVNQNTGAYSVGGYGAVTITASMTCNEGNASNSLELIVNAGLISISDARTICSGLANGKTTSYFVTISGYITDFNPNNQDSGKENALTLSDKKEGVTGNAAIMIYGVYSDNALRGYAITNGTATFKGKLQNFNNGTYELCNVTLVEYTDDAIEFSKTSYAALTATCEAYGPEGITDSQWNALASAWNDVDSYAKLKLQAATSSDSNVNIANWITRYTIIVGSGKSDFMNLGIQSSRFIGNHQNISSDAAIFALVAISMVTMTVVGAYFFLRKKKEVK